MKKILFVINSLTIGGSENSLVSLLNSIDYSKYQVDLMMFKTGGEFERYIPNDVNILDEPDYYKYLKVSKVIESKLKRVNYKIVRLKTSLYLRINGLRKQCINSEQILYKSQNKVIDKINKKYDVAIAYSQGMPTYFVADKVDAERKLAWINCDYATTIYDKEFDELYYNKFYKIIAVSKTIEESIIKIKPQYKEKIKVILDIVNPNLIEKMSEEKTVFEDKSYINILTVARLVIHHKGYDIAVKVAKLLKNDGYKFKWYVVGDGQDRTKLDKLIADNDIQDCFILLGKKENPYPYMKNCDIYVQPSKKEGFGLTVVEAKILKKHIVCTNFNTAKELINNEEDGLIVKQNEEDLYYGIKRYLTEENLRNKIAHNLQKNEAYTSVKEIEKIYGIL